MCCYGARPTTKTTVAVRGPSPMSVICLKQTKAQDKLLKKLIHCFHTEHLAKLGDNESLKWRWLDPNIFSVLEIRYDSKNTIPIFIRLSFMCHIQKRPQVIIKVLLRERLNVTPLWKQRPCLKFFVKNGSPKKGACGFCTSWAPVRLMHSSKFRTEMITLLENTICFPLSTLTPWGSTWEPRSCMSSLFHWEFSPSSSSSQREGGGVERLTHKD